MRRVLLAFAGACAVALGVSASSSFAASAVDVAAPKFAGAWSVNPQTGQATPIAGPNLTRASTDFGYYNNLDNNADANAGISLASNTNPTFGDEIHWDPSANLGTLDDFWLTIYNSTSGGNTGTITGGILNVDFFRLSDSSHIGGFSADTSTIFAANPLAAGFYTVIQFSNLSLLGTPINLDTTGMVLLQHLAPTGTSTRNGIVSFNPVDLGSSPSYMYESSTTVAAGFYNFGNPIIQTNPGYLIGVIAPEPTSLAVVMLSGVGLLARRRQQA